MHNPVVLRVLSWLQNAFVETELKSVKQHIFYIIVGMARNYGLYFEQERMMISLKTMMSSCTLALSYTVARKPDP